MIDPTIYRYAHRDIILIKDHQPMYRSSGHNSGMPGVWLPFDGIARQGTWFDKTAYCFPVSDIHRFGTQELKDLSDELGVINIPMGEEASYATINTFLKYTGG